MAEVQSVANALRVLEAFLQLGENLGPNEVGRVLHLSPSSVYRLMTTLRERNFLEQDSRSRKFRVGPKMLEIGLLYLRRQSFAALTLECVQRALPEYTCFVGVLAGDDVLILGSREGTGPIKIGSRLGERRHVHCSAVGKALLTLLSDEEVRALLVRVGMPRKTAATITDPDALIEQLRDSRARGYVVNDEESVVGVVSVGVVVRDSFGNPLGATSVAMPKFLAPPERVHDVGRILLATASELSRRLADGCLPEQQVGLL